eukprot:6045276-Prymnesium_polylepis.1
MPATAAAAAAAAAPRSAGVQPCSVRRGGRSAMSAFNCFRCGSRIVKCEQDTTTLHHVPKAANTASGNPRPNRR